MMSFEAYKRGEALTAEKLNNNANALRNFIQGGDGIAVQRTPNGASVVNEQQPQIPAGSIYTFEITSSTSDDYLTCKSYSFATASGAGTFYVAKPFQLQVTPFDSNSVTYPSGQTISYSYSNNYTRTATETSPGSGSETQVITPEYFNDDIIQAVRVNTGITGGDGSRVVFMDINTAGRAWAAQ